MLELIRRIRNRIGQRGFTLVELMVVMGILSVLSTIVMPAVTGVGTTGRGTARALDVNHVQKAVDTFTGEDATGGWPTATRSLPGAPDYVADIDWSAVAEAPDESKLFVPNYLIRKPAHADEDTTYAEFTDSAGNTVAVPAGTGVWVLDRNGIVFALIDEADY